MTTHHGYWSPIYEDAFVHHKTGRVAFTLERLGVPRAWSRDVAVAQLIRLSSYLYRRRSGSMAHLDPESFACVVQWPEASTAPELWKGWLSSGFIDHTGTPPEPELHEFVAYHWDRLRRVSEPIRTDSGIAPAKSRKRSASKRRRSVSPRTDRDRDRDTSTPSRSEAGSSGERTTTTRASAGPRAAPSERAQFTPQHVYDMWRKALDTPLNTPEKCPMSVSTVIGRHLYKEKKSWQWFHDFFSAAAENAHLWGQEWKPDLPWLLGNPQNTDRILSRYWKFSGFARGDSAPVHLPDLP